MIASDSGSAVRQAQAIPPLTIRLFGSFAVQLRGETLPDLRSRKGEWLLALLVLRHGREVERGWLAGLLWPGSPERQALANLRNCLTDLRRALGPEAERLRSPSAHTLALDVAGTDVDVVVFDVAVARGDEAALEEAVAVYRGPLLEGCAEEWAFEEREARQQEYLQALEQLAASALARDEPAAAERFLRRAVLADPARETAQRELMRALAASGSYAAAILAYRALRLHLHQQLNVQPAPETQSLFETIRAEARARATGKEGARERGSEGARERRGPILLPPALTFSLPHSLTPSLPPSSSREVTVTFLFTDIAESTRLWEEQPEAMRVALERHDTLLRDAIETNDGQVFKTVGDAFCATFETPAHALDAALSAQRALASQLTVDSWQLAADNAPPSASGATVPVPVQAPPATANCQLPTANLPLRVRMALHTGVAERRDGDYFGPTLNRVSRLLEMGHGGQVLLSAATRELVQDDLPPGAALVDLGVHRLRDLQRTERVFHFRHADLSSEFPPLASLDTPPNNLPEQLNRFIGREREIAEVKALLGVGQADSLYSGISDRQANSLPYSRLVTVTGPGGTGKTRLSLQVAAELLAGERDGVWLVELAGLSDAARVPQTVAAALGVREAIAAELLGERMPAERLGTRPEARSLMQSLVEYLRSRDLLLVLDNCEHLVGACAELADALLRACPGVRILATSRERLNVAGETTYRLPSLSLPEGRREGAMVDGQWLMSDDRSSLHPPSTINHQPSALMQSEAVRLFVDRAVAALPTFAVSEQNAAAVAQVCSRLDGIPLAIELAAARVRALPVEKINERLDDRFRLLTGGSRTAPPRQQTLRALIDWSYDLLTETEQALLRRLSVFSGGWTLEAAEAVCGDEEDGGAEGVGPVPGRQKAEGSPDGGEGSEQKAVGSPDGGEGSEQKAVGSPDGPSLLPTAYCLLPSDVLDLLASLVEKSLVQYEEEGGVGRYRLLETVRQYGWERVRETGEAAALRERHGEWCVALADAAETAMRGPELVLWLERLDAEHDNLRAALEWSVECAPQTGLRLVGGLWVFWMIRGHMSEGRESLARALESAAEDGPTPARARALAGASALACFQADAAGTELLCEECLAVARAVGSQENIAMALMLQTYLYVFDRWDAAQSKQVAAEGAGVAREQGEQWLIAMCVHSMGVAALWAGELDRAQEHLEESLALFRAIENRWLISFPLVHLGFLAVSRGELERATALCRESLALQAPLGDRWGMALSLKVLAEVAVSQGQPARGARLLGSSAALYESLGVCTTDKRPPGHERLVAVMEETLGEAAFAAAWSKGRAMKLPELLGGDAFW